MQSEASLEFDLPEASMAARLFLFLFLEETVALGELVVLEELVTAVVMTMASKRCLRSCRSTSWRQSNHVWHTDFKASDKAAVSSLKHASCIWFTFLMS